MKNRYRNSQYDRNRYAGSDRYGRSNFDDRFDNNYDDNRNYPGQYNRDYNRPNYNYPQSNVNNYTGYSNPYNSNPQPYRHYSSHDYESRQQSTRNWQHDDRQDRHNNYEDDNYKTDDYNSRNRNWWDRTRDEVSSWFGDDDAERRRRMDEMRDENHRGKGPKNYTRSAERIKEDVNDKLSDNWMLDASEIEVDVKGNEVTLNGNVDSKQTKRRAEDIADSVSGVMHVQNNLRVKTSDNTPSKDSTTYSARSRKETLNNN